MNKYVESKTKSMLVALTHMRDGAAKGLAHPERTGEGWSSKRFIRVPPPSARLHSYDSDYAELAPWL